MAITWLRDPVTGLWGRAPGDAGKDSCREVHSCTCRKTTFQCGAFRPPAGTCGVHRPAGGGHGGS